MTVIADPNPDRGVREPTDRSAQPADNLHGARLAGSVPVVADGMRPDANNFTIVRLVLASAVIWTHSIWRVTGQSGVDQFSPWLGVPVSHIAVDGFFFLSGLLVYASLDRRHQATSFLLARFARVWPGLAVAVTVTVVAGLFITAAAPGAYFRGATMQFLIQNLSLLSNSYFLTGIMCGDQPCVINGSLWTISWEVRCYLLLALLAALGLASRRMMLWLVLPASLIFAVLWRIPIVQGWFSDVAPAGAIYFAGMWERLWSMFALGIAAFLLRDHIRLSWMLLLLLAVVMLAVEQMQWDLPVRALFVAYGVLCFGMLTARGGSVSSHWPDYSYGMYIYAFPLMMAVAVLLPGASAGLLALVTFAATLPCAALSWHVVEKPALDRVRRPKTPAQTG